MKTPRAIFFDLDGTLLDVSARFHRALNEARQAEGLGGMAWEEFIRRYGRGVLSEGVAPARVGPFWKNFLEAFSHNPAPHPGTPFPGVPEMLDQVRGRGLAAAIITNRACPGRQVHAELEGLGLARHFEAVLSQGDFNFRLGDYSRNAGLYSKVSMIEDAARRLGVEPAHAAVVGDLLTDIESGRLAGCAHTVGVLTGGMPREALERAGASHILEGAAQIAEWLDSL